MSNPPKEPTPPADEDNLEAAFERWEQARPTRYEDGTTDLPLTEEELLLDHELARSPEALLAAAERQTRLRLIFTLILSATLLLAVWLNRDDLTTVIPDFIRLAEAQYNRSIRHRKMITRSTATIDSRYSATPADWIQTVQLILLTDPV